MITRCVFTTLVISVSLFAADLQAGQQTPGPQGPEQGVTRRQLWLVPLPGERLLMHATLLRPPGAGPFPLAVINHGSSQSSLARATTRPSDYPILSQWFLDRGFAVVLPLRPGHATTGGPYFEDQGRCESADYRKAGLATADSIQAAINDLTAQPFVRKSGVVVVGQSAGGWGGLALASRNPSMVSAVINFAGGRGGRSDDLPNNNCVPDRLVATAGEFGSTARIQTLWLYSQNDSYFAPALSKSMYTAFLAAGGHARISPAAATWHGWTFPHRIRRRDAFLGTDPGTFSHEYGVTAQLTSKLGRYTARCCHFRDNGAMSPSDAVDGSSTGARAP